MLGLFPLSREVVISSAPEPVLSATGPTRDAAQAAACASWFRQLARALKTSRLYRGANPLAQRARDEVADLLENLLVEHRGWDLHFTATDMMLGDQFVIRPRARNGKDTAAPNVEERLPFVFYRDGIRGLHIRPGIPRNEIDAFIDALGECGWGTMSHDDLLTLLWQANLTHVEIESVPLEQTIVLSDRGEGTDGRGSTAGPAYVQVASGAKVREHLLKLSESLHHDYADWDIPDSTVEVQMAYALLSRTEAAQREKLLAEWAQESTPHWGQSAGALIQLLLDLDPDDPTRAPLCHATATWLGDAIRRGAWLEASGAMEQLAKIDPSLTRGRPEIERALSRIDYADLAEMLDETEGDEHMAFAALAVALGPAGVEMTVGILSHAAKTRTHAAASTALCYQCADDPEVLSRFIGDSRADTVLHLAFVLGQIGGPQVVSMLQLLARHPEPRVRRQAIQSLGGVPEEDRLPALEEGLHTLDPQILSATLSLLTRRRNPQVSMMILGVLEDPTAAKESPDIQRMLFQALGDVAGDEVVPALKAMVTKGWVFARASFARQAAAHALQRIGTKQARSILAEGMHSWNAAVRRACLEAMNEKEAA